MKHVTTLLGTAKWVAALLVCVALTSTCLSLVIWDIYLLVGSLFVWLTSNTIHYCVGQSLLWLPLEDEPAPESSWPPTHLPEDIR